METTGGSGGTPPPESLPDNGTLARELLALAGYLDFEGESVYRVLAYRKAASTFMESSLSVARLLLEGRGRDLPGVGPAIEAKVSEYLHTGRIERLEEFRARYPESILTLATLPGVGPKTARRIHDHLGIADVDDLEKAARSGQLQTVPGLGPASEAKLLAVLEERRTRGDDPAQKRRLLGDVEAQAEEIVSVLRAHPAVEQAEAGGSLRRRRETIGDLDMVVATTDPTAVGEYVAGSALVAAVEQSGTTKMVFRTHNGIAVDLRMVTPPSFGNLLQHATGSAAHNVALRGHAQRRGSKVCEYDIEDTVTGHKRTCRTEAEVYELLGLSWIPPELREDRGEIEAAERGGLPRLIERGDLKGDLHVHSNWSDGRLSIEAMALAARDRGLEYVCFCDHSKSLGMGVGLHPEEVLQQIEEVRGVDARLDGITVLAGSEVDILADGEIDLPDHVLEQLDFVTASIHSGFRQPRDRIMGRLSSAVRHPFVDAIGHPTGRLLNRRDPYPIDVSALAEEAREYGTLLEINAAYDRLDLRAAHARQAVALGARVVVCSDAHSAAGLDLLRYGIDEARRGWLRAQDVANTSAWADLRAGLRMRAGGR